MIQGPKESVQDFGAKLECTLEPLMSGFLDGMCQSS